MQSLLNVPGSSGVTIDVGFSPALPSATGYLWVDGANVLFREGGPRSMPGWTSLATINERARALAQFYDENSAEPRAYAGTDDSLLLWQSTPGAVILKTGFNSGNWSLAPRGTQLLATNGVDPLQYWAGTIGVAPTEPATQFTTAKIIRVYKQFAVAFNTTGGAASGKAAVEWSNDDDVTTWDSADNFYIRDMQGAIEAVEPMGDDMALYTRDGLWLMSYFGGDYIFGFQKVLDDVGVWGKNAVCSVGRQHFGWGPRGPWVTDGLTTVAIAREAMDAFLKEDLNTDAADKIVALHDEIEQLVIFFYPSGAATECDVGAAYHYGGTKGGSWTKFDFGRSAAMSKSAFDFPVVADASKLYEQGRGADADGATLTSWVQSAPLDMGSEEQRKRIQGLRLVLKDASTLTLELGAQEEISDAIDWYYSGSATTLNHIPDRETARLSIKLTGTAPWLLTGFSILGQPGGFTI